MRKTALIYTFAGLLLSSSLLGNDKPVGEGNPKLKPSTTHSTILSKFRKELGGGKFDEGKKIVETQDGGLLVAGRTVAAAGSTDVSLWKLSASGDVQWDYTFGGLDSEEVADLKVASDGGFLVLGSSDSYGAGPDIKDMWLLKVDKNGKEEWYKNYGTAISIDEGHALSEGHDGGYIVVGRSFAMNTQVSHSNIYAIKTNDLGEIVWEKHFGGEKNDEGVDVLKTEQGYVILGNTESRGKGKWDAMLFGLDKEGNKLWEQTYGGGDTDKANGFIPATDGKGFVIVGYTYTFAQASLDSWIIRVGEKGEQLWHKVFGGLSTDEAYAVIEASDKNYVMVGYTEIWQPDEYGTNTSVEGHNIYLVKFDDKGGKIWDRAIGGEGDQRGYDLLEAKDKGIVVVGSHKSTDEKEYSTLVIKVNENGLQ